MRILIKNGLVMLNKNNRIVCEKSNVLIKDRFIDYVGMNEECDVDKVIDATNQLVMPGLINMHTHIPMKVLQGLAEGMRLEPWLEDVIWPLEGQMTEDDVEIASKMSILEMINSGITCFNDMYFHENSIAKAVNALGIRAILCKAFFDFNVNDEMIVDAKKFIEKYNRTHLIDVSLGIHQLCDMSKENMNTLLNEFRGLTDYLHIHIAETSYTSNLVKQNTGLTECEYLLTYDLEGYNVLAAHCVHFNSKDVKLIKGSTIYPINNPVSNAKLASGISPVTEFVKEDIKACIGTDGSASNNNLNMFEEMKIGALVQKFKYDDPQVGNPEDFIKMATINASHALKKDQFIGSIEVGKLADIVTFPIDDVSMLPHHNLINNLVYSGTNLTTVNVIIDGKIIKEDNKLMTGNEKEIIKDFNVMTKELLERVQQ